MVRQQTGEGGEPFKDSEEQLHSEVKEGGVKVPEREALDKDSHVEKVLYESDVGSRGRESQLLCLLKPLCQVENCQSLFLHFNAVESKAELPRLVNLVPGCGGRGLWSGSLSERSMQPGDVLLVTGTGALWEGGGVDQTTVVVRETSNRNMAVTVVGEGRRPAYDEESKIEDIGHFLSTFDSDSV